MEPAHKRCPWNRNGSFSWTIFTIFSDALAWEELQWLKIKLIILNKNLKMKNKMKLPCSCHES
jgi:hypothetical protein